MLFEEQDFFSSPPLCVRTGDSFPYSFRWFFASFRYFPVLTSAQLKTQKVTSVDLQSLLALYNSLLSYILHWELQLPWFPQTCNSLSSSQRDHWVLPLSPAQCWGLETLQIVSLAGQASDSPRFPSLGDNSPLLPDVQCLETIISYLLSSFLVLSGGRVCPVPTVPSWLKAGALICNLIWDFSKFRCS